MKAFQSQLLAAILSFAIFAVTATCTSAGCLIPSLSASTANSALPCCAAHADGSAGTPNHGDRNKDCPLCHQSIQIGKATEKASSTVDLHALTPLLLAAFFVDNASGAQRSSLSQIDSPGAPFRTPSTLLSLHCALLN